MALKTLRQLIRERPTEEELSKIRNEIRKVHDRAAAILSVTLIDDALEDLLLAQFGHLSKSERLELFEGEGPLGSLSAKIKIGHALSLISPRRRVDLMLTKDIRNVFAHASGNITFQTPEVANACSKLRGIENIKAADLELPADRTWPPTDPRDRFVTSCALFSLALEWQAEDIKKERQQVTGDAGPTSSP